MKPGLRAVPLAVLLAIAAASAIARVSRSPRTPPPSAGTTTTSASTSADAVAPLRGPSPPPSADVPSGSPRTAHGGPRRTHRAEARAPRAVRVAWRVDVGAPVAAQVTAAPDGATIYVATLGGQLVALDRESGERRWSLSLGDRAYAAPLVHEDGTVYVGSDAKKLFAVSPKGEIVFALDVDGEADTAAAFAKDGAIVFAAGRHVHAVRRGGDLAWRFAARGKVYTAVAITDDGLVVVGSQDHHVYAIGPGGVLAWATDLGADVDGAPAIGDDGSIVVGTDAGDVVRLDPKGQLQWRTPVAGFVRGALSIARNGDVVVGTYGPAPRLVRVAPDGVVRGSFAVPGTGAKEFGIHGGPLEDADGVLVFGAQDDRVRAIGPDGVLRWELATGGDVDAPLSLLADGSLVVASEDGFVTRLVEGLP